MEPEGYAEYKAAIAKSIFAMFLTGECPCPKCRREKTKSNEQAALRGYHGRAYEYVWSDVLNCHVLIGE
jgi:hypothetical protein